jgi:hypothetical protein
MFFLLQRMQMELDRRDPYWTRQVSPINPSSPYDWGRVREPIMPLRPSFESRAQPTPARVWNLATMRFE